MSQTLTTYTTLVQNEVDDASSSAQTVIQEFIKETYADILKFVGQYLIGIAEEDVTASTSNRYVTPTNTYQNVRKVLWHNATDTDFTELKQITEEEYYARHVNDDTSDPAYWYRNGDKIYFDVVPSTAGTVKVMGVEVQDELVTTSLIPDRYTNVVVLGAVARFKAYDSDPATPEYMGMYQGALQAMVKDYATSKPVLRPKLYGLSR